MTTSITSFLLTLAQATTPASPATPGGTPAVQPPGIFTQMIPFFIIAVIFYFLIIRPQQKRFKDHKNLVDSVKTGDEVIMSQGIHGIVSNVKEATIMVKVADNVKIEFDKAALTRVVKSSQA